MANYNVTGSGGTTGHPTRVRRPYLIENTVDVSAINGDSGAAQNDILRVLDVPAETVVLHASMEILTQFSNSVTLDLGMTQVSGVDGSLKGNLSLILSKKLPFLKGLLVSLGSLPIACSNVKTLSGIFNSFNVGTLVASLTM